MTPELSRILQFVTKAEQLKKEMRHSWLSNDRRESVAEHTWRMSLMAVLLRDHLEVKVDLERVLKMIIIHDLVEIEAGDIPVLDILNNPEVRAKKATDELDAINNIREELGETLGEEIRDLWMEFESKGTNEAKFANALDKLEVQIQHNHASLKTWEEIEFELVYTMDKHVDFDQKLIAFKDLIVAEAETKMRKAGKDPEVYKPVD